jgi:hypothetical protein
MEEQREGLSLTALIGFCLAALLFGAMFVVLGQFAKMYREMGIELPSLTKLALSSIGRYAIGIGLMTLFLLALIIPEEAGRHSLTLLGFIGMGCALVFYVVALYTPMITVMNALQE